MPEQKPAVFPLDISSLISTGRHTDRFSYSSYFVPVKVTYKDDPDTPILTFPQRTWVSRFGSSLPDEVMEEWLEELRLSRLATRNHIEFPNRAVVPPAPVAGNAGGRRATDSLERTVADLQVLARVVSSRLTGEGGEVSTMLTETVNRLARESAAAAAAEARERPRMPYLDRGPIGEAATDDRLAGAPAEEGKDLLLTLLQSEVGYLFLDRTRIRPAGFAMGEHIYSLSLAPSEEVTLEQKTFTKRTLTLEEANERERTMDMELASTLSTELNESMDRSGSVTNKSGFNVSHTGGYKSPSESTWGSIDASHTIGYTSDVTTAANETSRRSIRDSKATSAKLSARFRSLHKVTFNVKTEMGFESTSRRVLRNQNRFTPVDYHFFKILRVVELAQERYGAVLCWAPFVRSPAAHFFTRIQNGKSAILARAAAKIPREPTAPQAKLGEPAATKVVWSNSVLADRWGGYHFDMSADYVCMIPVPSGWEWDGDVADVASKIRPSDTNVSDDRYSVSLVGEPWIEESNLKVRLHVGCKPCLESGDDGVKGRIYLMVGATFMQVAAGDPAEGNEYAAAYEDYVGRRKAWEEESAKITKAAAEEADEWEKWMLENANPVNELINRLISEHFVPEIRDEGAEIELWHRLFQWDEASHILYPGWWSDEPLRDSRGDPSSFFNASWARLYLPIRPGMEKIALRFIYSKRIHDESDTGMIEAIDELASKLDKYREKYYPTTVTPPANPGECPKVTDSYVCLGRWEETLPTDGTHIEVTQSATLSIDPFAQKDLEDTAALRQVVLDSRKQDVAIKQTTANNLPGSATVEVKIRTDADLDGDGN